MREKTCKEVDVPATSYGSVMVRPMDGDVERLARNQNGLFTAVQARTAGATAEMVRHRVRTGRWLPIHSGVFALVGAQNTPRFRLHAAVLAAGDDAVASHRSAAGLLGIPGFTLPGREIEVTTRSYTRRRRTPAHVRGTLLLPSHHHRVVLGVPCTSVARTLFDLCGSLQPDRAERALDNALARRMVELPALWRVLDDSSEHGRAGSTVLRRLLAERGGRCAAPESELERRFIELLRSHGLPEPLRQIDLGDADSWIGRVDFVYPQARLVIECDGALGHSALLDRRADGLRDHRLSSAGWSVIRFTWTDVTNHPFVVAARVRQGLAGAAAA
jgi:very-short-patch-repair endonuclease